MNNFKNGLLVSGVLLLTLGVTGCSEESSSSESATATQRMESNLESLGIEKPRNWEEMSSEEKTKFMQSQERRTGQRMGNGAGGNNDRMKIRFEEAGIDMPDNWMEMSQEERQTFMNDNEIELSGGNL